MLKDHSKELLDLEWRLERVINNALDTKDDEISSLWHKEEYHRIKLEELADDVRKS